MKRVVDVSLAALLLLLALPLALLIVVLIRLDSSGPIFTQSHRVGRNGRMVKVWEFRTAHADPEAMETVGGCHGEEVTYRRRFAKAGSGALAAAIRGIARRFVGGRPACRVAALRRLLPD